MLDEFTKLGINYRQWSDLIKNKFLPLSTSVDIFFPDSHTMYISIYKENANQDGQFIAKFGLSFMYGCKGILISHSMLVDPAFRNQGIAKKIQPIKESIARDLKVTTLFATVRADNEVEKRVIHDWTKIDEFINQRTSNKIEVFVKKL